MERRILGWVMSFAHVVLAAGFLGMFSAFFRYFWLISPFALGAETPWWWGLAEWAPLFIAIFMLIGWDLAMSGWARSSVRRGNDLAIDGHYAEASETLRRLQDHE